MPKKYQQGRNFCVTINNYAEDDIEKLKSCEYIKYGIMGKEVGSAAGTPHLQGYIQCTHAIKTTESGMAKKLKKLLGKQPACFIQNGTVEEAVQYCKKEEDWEEWGTRAEGQGSRTDIDSFLSEAKTMDELDLAEKYPKEYARYYKAAERVRNLAEERRERQALKDKLAEVEMHEWQKDALDHLYNQDDRKVTWVVDFEGGKGKTWLAKWLIAHKEAFYMQGGKMADIAHAYKGEEYVVCDYTRDKEDIVQYSAIESLKNGIIFSPKYDSRTKVRGEGAKIICFSNWEPDTSKLSKDRWDIIYLDKADEKSSRWDSWDFAAQ